ncbi:DUF6049 family protein [Saccharomonospora sp. NPDC046836]|uniref:DUF6049 family protein n=1 Tax=Saccharomonospora sp. NPDC046836 TaxID=3156921 RepID=UPI0033DAF782
MSKLSALALALAFLIAQGLSGATVAAQPLAAPNWLRLDVAQLSPRMVTPSTDELVVTGTVTNVSDRTITEVVARLQLGARQTSPYELEQSLIEPPPTDSGASAWVGVADSLEPGNSVPVRISVPIAELPLSTPGVYPLLVNVNGTPAYGGAARLAAVHMFLPVLDSATGSGSSQATPVSVLWPITAAKPSVVSAPTGGSLVLGDDGVAAQLKPGGRLDALVSAAATQRDNPAVFGSLCFAIDPELLDTVEAMSNGYQVRVPGGQVEGSGRDDAGRWLAQLRALVAGHCVIQLPYADADLTAVSRISSPTDLVGTALNGASILEKLGVQPRRGVVWAGGTLDHTTARAVADAGVTTVITTAAGGDEQDSSVLDGTRMRGLSPDSLVATAMRGQRSDAASAQTPADQPAIATQNGLAALAFRTGLGENTSGTVLIAPPRRWDAPAGELVSFLDSLAALQAAGTVRPESLDEVLAAPPGAGTTGSNGGASGASTATVSSEVIGELSEVENTAADLQSAMTVDPTRQVQPAAVIQPLHNAVLRATSTAWQSDPSLRMAAAGSATAQLSDMRRQVTVTTLSQPVSLASGSSPLPVTLSNALPVAITVRIKLENSAGLRPARIQDTPLTADSKVSRYIPAEALRSGRFNVDVSLTTPGGTKLGNTARLELTSNEFGVVTVVLTATAAGALVLLSGRRLYLRAKGRRRTEGR